MTAVASLLLILLTLPGSAGRADSYHRYRGAVHIHTRYSDGSGTFEEVAHAAQAARLDYAIFSDHNTLQPLKDGHQRYWGRTLVLVGTEITTDVGHCLALDLPASFEWKSRDPQTVIDRVRAAGGFTILAHPMSPRWTWTNWGVHGYSGIEIINLAVLFDDDLLAATDGLRVQDRSVRRLAELAQRYLASPDRTMARLSNNAVERERDQWDRLLRKGQQVVGIASTDAHARLPVGGSEVKVPSYQEAFETVQTYVLTSQPLRRRVEQDRRQVYSAFRNGRLYTVYPRVAPAPEFRFTAQEADREAVMGQPFRLRDRVRLAVEAPGHSHPLIRLLRDGVEVVRKEGKRVEWSTAVPGVYRAEVYARVRKSRPRSVVRGLRRRSVRDLLRSRARELQPWIFSNPIYVRK